MAHDKNAWVKAMEVQVQIQVDADSPEAFMGRTVLSQELVNYAVQIRPHPA